MTVPTARQHPLLRRYPLRRLRLPMAGGTLSIVVPAAADWLHRGGWADAAAHGAEPPYWADVWPSSLAIARWLARRSLEGVRVLDLGCGIGVPGAAAARAGACVTFADLHRDALAFAAFNAGNQGAPPDRIACVQHDWHGPTLAKTFGIVVLADVTYRPVHHPALLRHVRACLQPGGLLLHADPFRRESDGFLVQLARDFTVRQEVVATHLEDRRLSIRLSLAAHGEEVLDGWCRTGGGDSRDAAAATGAR